MTSKKRYRLIQNKTDNEYLIEDRKLEIETPYFKDLNYFLYMDFTDKYDGEYPEIRTSLIEFESFEEFKEEYPEYFI